MNRGRTVFALLLEFIPFSHFEHPVDRFAANRGIGEFTAWSHLLRRADYCMTEWMGQGTAPGLQFIGST